MDPRWNPDAPLTTDEMWQLARSTDVDERRLVAGFYMPPLEILDYLAEDDDEAVLSALLQQHSAPEDLIRKIVRLHPEFADFAKHHDNAPPEILALRWLSYMGPLQLERFLAAHGASPEQAAKMRSLTEQMTFAYDETLTTRQAWEMVKSE